MFQRLYDYLIKGWKFSYRTPDVENQFKRTDRMICISAHSTPFLDGILLHESLKHFGIYRHLIYVKGLFGFAPNWCKEITTPFFISNEIRILNSKDCFCRVFFPSDGTVQWKSGFYVLAKETNATIVVIGINYKTKNIQIDSCFSTDEDYFTIKSKSIIQLKKYEANSLYFLWRILFGYGCLTYDISLPFLQLNRICLFSSSVIFLSYFMIYQVNI